MTPDQFYSFTPLQIQRCLKYLDIRVHNDIAENRILNGFKAKYIDTRMEQVYDNIRNSNDDTDMTDGANSYLDKLRAKNG